MPRINRGKIFLFANLFFIGGILAGYLFSFKLTFLWLSFFLFSFLFYKRGRLKRILLPVFFILLAFTLGFSRVLIEKNILAENNISELSGNKITGFGEFRKCQLRDKGELKCQLDNLRIQTDEGLKFYQGKLLVFCSADLSKDYQFGNQLSFSGLLEEAENFNGFNYQGYLLKDGIYAILRNQEINLLVQGKSAERHLSPVMRLQRSISGFRVIVEKKIAGLWQGEILGIMKALLLGDKSFLSEELTENFQKVGISHLVAISGMHITIITDLLLNFFFFLGLHRRIAFGGVIMVLFLFVILIGMPASAVRALIMGSLGFLAKLLGRKIQANILLFFTASLLLTFNPLLIFYDVGFQLSFCAVWGIFNLMPFLENFFNLFVKWKRIRQVISLTISAQLATFPVIIYHFHYLSIISILANLLIFWSVFPIIFAGIISLGLAFLNLELANFFALLAHLGILYLIKVTENLGAYQYAGIEINGIKWGWIGLLILIFGLFLFKDKKAERVSLSPT
jgi:competence protein ComEC